MSNTIINTSNFTLWLSDHDPLSSENVNSGAISYGDRFINTNNNNLFMCIDPTIDALQWVQITTTVYTP